MYLIKVIHPSVHQRFVPVKYQPTTIIFVTNSGVVLSNFCIGVWFYFLEKYSPTILMLDICNHFMLHIFLFCYDTTVVVFRCCLYDFVDYISEYRPHKEMIKSMLF